MDTKYLDGAGTKKLVQDIYNKIPRLIRVETEEDALLLSQNDTENIYFVAEGGINDGSEREENES